MRNLFWTYFAAFAGICLAAILSGCATIGDYAPRATIETNVSIFYHTVEVYNSAGAGVELVPQSRNSGFVAEYRYGKRTWRNLWLCREKIPTKLVTLKHGQKITLPFYRGASQRVIEVPFAVKVIERGKEEGFYTYCLRSYPHRDSNFQINFGKRELQALKRGYTGRACNGGGYYY